MLTLNAKLRTEGKANALRRQGFVPAVIYGPTIDSTPIIVGQKELRALFAKITRSSRIELSVSDHEEGKKLDVFVKAIQYNPITDEPIHVDFYHPDTGRPLRLHVPIRIVGEAPGVKAGGVLNVLFRTILVHGLPKDIPPIIELDVSNLGIGEGIRVRDVDFGNVEPLLPPERALVTVVAPRGLEEAAGGGPEEEGEAVEEAATEEGTAAQAAEEESA